MTRLIDADALKEYIDCGHLRSPAEVCFSELDVVNMLDKCPTIDAVPVIRCKDCEYYGYEELGHRCVYDQYVETGEEFCSWAERRGEE